MKIDREALHDALNLWIDAVIVSEPILEDGERAVFTIEGGAGDWDTNADERFAVFTLTKTHKVTL